MTEKELIQGIKRHNEKCFDAIYNKYYKLVLYVILKYVDNKDDAEDLAVDTFITMYNKIDQHNDAKSFKYWLLTIAKNKARRYLDKNRNSEVIDTEYISIQPDNNSSYNMLLKSCSMILTPIEFDVLNYHVVFDMTFKEISKLCNISQSEAFRTYKRAILKLKEEM